MVDGKSSWVAGGWLGRLEAAGDVRAVLRAAMASGER